MMRRFVPVALLAVVTVSALYFSALPPARPDALTYPALVFKLPVVEPLQLPNGMKLYLQEDHELPLVEMTALVGAGNIVDPAAKTGQGALFAALLQAGGAGQREPLAFSGYLEKYAIDLSVSTDSYTTVLDLSLLAEDLDVGLSVLDDLLRRPRFDAGRLEVLRQQMLESVRRENDLPESIAERGLNQAIYGDHPFGRSSTVATINALTRADLVAFQQRYFVPENLSLSISGDFDRQVLLERLQKKFSDWPATGYQSEPIPPLVTAQPPAIWLAKKDVPQTTVLLGEVGIAKDNPDLQAVRLMNYILGGGGFNSRLMREIRSNRGLAYSVYSYYAIGRRLPGPFIAGGETSTATTLEMLRLILAEMERVRSEPVSTAELALAKESLINSFVFAFDDAHDVLTQKMRLDFYGYPPDYLQTYRDKVAAVTVTDVQRVANQYLNPQQMAIVLVGRTDDFFADASGFSRPVRWLPVSSTRGGNND